MKSIGILLICLMAYTNLSAQPGSIKGTIKDESNAEVEFANILLYTDCIYRLL